MLNNYDPIARNYDWLSRIIFGRNLINSQTCLIQHIPAKSKILIVGGGTGWILEEIAKIHSSGLSITYVEISKNMIELARKCNARKNEVIFVNLPIEQYQDAKPYDIVITAFLLDNFASPRIEQVFEHINNMLSHNGKWLFADFYIEQKSGLWQKLLLKSMITFFRIICNIEARKLTPIDPLFENAGLTEIYTFRHFHGFIRSSVFIRTSLNP